MVLRLRSFCGLRFFGFRGLGRGIDAVGWLAIRLGLVQPERYAAGSRDVVAAFFHSLDGDFPQGENLSLQQGNQFDSLLWCL